MIGRRLPDSPDGIIPKLEPGDYVRVRTCYDWSDLKSGTWIWIVKSPTGVMCYLNDKHTFTEHENGALSVNPSIQMYSENKVPAWHGYLINGVWSEC